MTDILPADPPVDPIVPSNVKETDEESIEPSSGTGSVVPDNALSPKPGSGFSGDFGEKLDEDLSNRVFELEKKVYQQNEEILSLRSTLADAVRRINQLEGKGHVQVNNVSEHHGMRRVDARSRRPLSATYSSPARTHNHEGIDRRASYTSSREKNLQKATLRKSVLYQSTGSLHSDGMGSMSPAPSPSPTPAKPPSLINGKGSASRAPLSGSMTNLTSAKKWNSANDFREQSPVVKRFQQGSLYNLKSPYGSQQNLHKAPRHHGQAKEAMYNLEESFVKLPIRPNVPLYIPSDLADSYSISKVAPAPIQKLRLEWVYGYRGKDARSNLYLLPTGEIIYFVAAVVVMFNAEERTQRHYVGHTDEIKCLAIHPNKHLVASGQSCGNGRREGRPHIRLWNSVSLQTLHILGGGEFTQSINCISFSKADGGNFLLAVEDGPDHTMSIWDWQRGDRGQKITETKCSTETVVAAEFHPLEGGTIVSCGKGHVNFWTLVTYMDNSVFTLSRKTGLFDTRDKPRYVTCLAFSQTGDLITGDSNGNVFIWGRGYNAVTKALRKVHDGPIFCIYVQKDGSIITGGGKDRKILLFDALYRRTGTEAELPDHLGSARTITQGRGQLLVGTTRNCIIQGTFELSFHEVVAGHLDEIWGLATHPQQNQFLTAAYDRHICLWDAITTISIWNCNIGDQAQSASFSPDGEVIVIAMVTGKWLVLDARTREVYGVYQDGVAPIQAVKFSPDGAFLALASSDANIYMYKAGESCKKYNRLGRCLGHSSAVLEIDWSACSTYLRSNSDDNDLLFWNAPICRQITDPSALKDMEWSSHSCPFAFRSIGVWSPDSGVSACSRSPSGKLLVTGDEFGKIRLYGYPASQPKSLSHNFGGHGSYVTKLEFLPDNSRVISTGGRDAAVLQWTVI